MRPTTLTSLAPIVGQTSTGTADVKTFAALPKNTAAAYLSVDTNPARVTFDGTTPDATHGVVLQTGVLHRVDFGEGTVVKFASTIAGNSSVNVIPCA